MNPCCFSECQSHPGRPLPDHLRSVEAAIAGELAARGNGSCGSFVALARLAGGLHDVGKATAHFQRYLAETGHRRTPYTPHAHLSALVTHHLGCRLLELAGLSENLAAVRHLVFATLAVARHHGDLEDLEEGWSAFVDKARQDDGVLVEQWSGLDCEGLRSFGEALLRDLGYPGDWLPPDADELRLTRYGARFRGRVRGWSSPDLLDAFAWRHLYSLLIGCDKLDAALYGELPEREPRSGAGALEQFRSRRFSSRSEPLSPLREAVFAEARQSFSNSKGRVFTLTAPTGSGKTLALLAAGFERRRHASGTGSPLPRILYCLPFTSIVDQNFEVCRQVLGGESVRPSLVTRHHHLSDFRYETEQAQYREEQAELLVETWQSEIVFTTFYQLLHGLFSHRNSEAKRFFRMPGSVLLLDEVQAIPRKYWELVRRALLHLAEEYGVTVILATATRPLIFREGDAVELCPKAAQHFEGLDRVTLVSRLSRTEQLSEFAKRLGLEIGVGRDDVLVIANTIASARYLHSRLRDIVSSEELFYLSTHLTPMDRLSRLRALAMRDRRRVLVSTQLVEAGVDLSFDRVYRDLAPLDSIIQASGRCNRSGGGPRGRVEVVCLEDDTQSSRRQPSAIYDGFLLDETRRVLPEEGEVPECEFLELTARYFERVKAVTADSELQEELARLRLATVGKELKLIEDSGPSQTYFVIRDPVERELWKEYRVISELEDRAERRRRFRAIRGEFTSRLIDVRCKPGQTPAAPVLALDAAGCPDGSYDEAIGFRPMEEATYVV